MTEPQKGVLAMALACVIWGISPVYYRQLSHVAPLEILSHRTVWSVAIFGIILAVQGRLPAVAAMFGTPASVLRLLCAGAMISLNWFLFIYSTQVDRVTESSLGYYIFPLMAVLVGVFFFGERLSRARIGAVALAFLAVVQLTWALGAAPWISLVLAVTFAAYGGIKKVIAAGPVVSVTAEVVLLAPLALVWLGGAHLSGWSGLGDQAPGVFGRHAWDSGLLVLSGALTAGPLILFSYAARRIALATAGVVQYLNPTLQFLCAIVVFGEVVTPAHAVAFPLIWLALAIYSLESLREERAARRAVIAAAASPATET